MQQKQTGVVFRIIVFSLTALMIGFVFFRSSMTAEASTVESNGTIGFLTNIFKSFGLSVEISDHLIRKTAHFAEFFVIGGLLMSCAYSFDRFNPYKYSFVVLFVGLFTAVIDEFIQLFFEGRSAEITDVLIDFSGVVTGALFMLLFYFIYIKIRYKKDKEK